ncbi:MAG: hypothetical protein ACLR4Z_10820 [Butyricicoccaceae bacterium]
MSPRRRSRTARPPSCSPSAASCAASPAGSARRSTAEISGERSKYLQETIITQRNGRFVVPVKAEHRGDVPGLVHDTSSTGATVFVEPQQVVEINNQIKVLEGREEAEIERILASLSAEVSMYKGAIEQDYDALTTLDFIFARAKLSFEMNAAAPSLLESGSRVAPAARPSSAARQGQGGRYRHRHRR